MATLNTPDGLQLYLHPTPPPAGPARGTVLIVHGLGEHGGRYAHVVAHLAAHGWATVVYDQRGHGRSTGPRGGIHTADSLLADLGQVISHTRSHGRDPVTDPATSPLVLLGHSMGGVVVGRFVAEGLASKPASWWQAVDGLVMSSPALDPGMNAFQKLLLAVAEPLAPTAALGNGLNPEWVCNDPAVVRAYVADLHNHDRITPRLVRFIVDGGAGVRAAAPRWTTPTLLLYAGADRCVAPRGSAAFATAAPVDVVAHQRYDGLAHEIFNEPEQARVLADLSNWLAARWPQPA